MTTNASQAPASSERWSRRKTRRRWPIDASSSKKLAQDYEEKLGRKAAEDAEGWTLRSLNALVHQNTCIHDLSRNWNED